MLSNTITKNIHWNLSINPMSFLKFPHHISYHVLPRVCPLPNQIICVLSGRSQLPDGATSKGLVNQLRQGAWTTAGAARAHFLKQEWIELLGEWFLVLEYSEFNEINHRHVLIICLLQTTNKPRANGNHSLLSWHLHPQQFQIFGKVIHLHFKIIQATKTVPKRLSEPV